LLAQLADLVGSRRVKHSQFVAEAARGLALRFAPELAAQGALAGLLHDNAKGMSGVELIELAQRYDIEVSPAERQFPALLHGKVGAALLPERFGVEDKEIAQCVADHVTGRVGMGELSRILFVADQIAKDRRFDGVEELRQVAAGNLERAVFLVAKYKLQYTINKMRIIEPMTVAVYNEFLGWQSRDGS
jgi:predicted HD superfamily hydrolase involved in NAD metabolism